MKFVKTWSHWKRESPVSKSPDTTVNAQNSQVHWPSLLNSQSNEINAMKLLVVFESGMEFDSAVYIKSVEIKLIIFRFIPKEL